MRLDRPIGTWLLFWPCAWSVALAAWAGGWDLFLWLALGAFAMRSAGCVYNDIVDRDLDRRSSGPGCGRWRAGGSSLSAAWVLVVALCLIGLVVLLQLDRTAQIVALASLALVAAYPFMKRITWWPQAWLGLVFSWGALVGWPAVTGSLEVPALWLYAGSDRLGDRLRHALRDPGHRGRRAGRGQILGAARWATRRRSASRSSTRWRSCCGAWRSGRCGPTGWRWSRLLPAALHLANQALRADPKDGDGALALFRSNRTCGLLMFLAMLVVGTAFDQAPPSLRRAHAERRPSPRDAPQALVERATAAGADAADALYVGDRSRGVQVRLGELEDVQRSEGEEIGLRLFRRPALGERFLVGPVGRRAGGAGRAGDGDGRRGAGGPICRAGARRAAACAASRPISTPTTRSSPTPPRFAPGRSRPRTPRSRVAGVTNSSGGERQRLGLDRRAGDQQRLRRRLSRDRLQLLGQRRSPAKARACSATMPVTAPATSRISRTPTRSAGSPASGRWRGSIRSSWPRARCRCMFDPRVASTLLGHFVGAISGASVARKASFLQDRLGDAALRARRDDHRRSAAPARPAVAAVRRRRAAGRAQRSGRRRRAPDWLADSASARQLGIQPTGHAARGVGGAPGAGPSNSIFAPGPRSREELLAAFPNALLVTELIGQGVNRRDRRLQPRRRRASSCRAARSPRRSPRSPSRRT